MRPHSLFIDSNEYNRNDDTMFLIHGWQNDGDTEWLQDTRRAYLNTVPRYTFTCINEKY